MSQLEKENFINQMSNEMKKQKISAAELAEMTGISKQMVYNYLKGTNFPSPNTMEKIKAALSIKKTSSNGEPYQIDNMLALYIKLAVNLLSAGNIQDGVCSILKIKKVVIPDDSVNLKDPDACLQIKEIILFGKDIYESYKDLSNDQKTTLNMFIDFEKFIYEQ